MKEHSIYEAAAAVLAMTGAGVLVSGLMPFINPGQLDIEETGEYSPRLIFLTGALFSLPLLGLSWHLNKKAQELRRQLEKPEQRKEARWERNLKWIIFGFVVLLVLYAFLW